MLKRRLEYEQEVESTVEPQIPLMESHIPLLNVH